MHMALKVLFVSGGVLSFFVGLLFLGGASLFHSIFAANGLAVDASLFVVIALACFAYGGLGCWGGFGENKLAGGTFCAIGLVMWPAGTIYSVICLLVWLFLNNNQETPLVAEEKEANQEVKQAVGAVNGELESHSQDDSLVAQREVDLDINAEPEASPVNHELLSHLKNQSGFDFSNIVKPCEVCHVADTKQLLASHYVCGDCRQRYL